ncbi:MAG: hypothetical protein J6B94_12800 [Lachnospiraceae bacterium]|nr:hypothetical protein [Lachnospiraceae bacterium]
MKKYELFVKKWYENLEEGKITAVKCNECGTVEFPPVYVCRDCSGTDMEWIEISGNAKILDIMDVKYMSSSISVSEMQGSTGGTSNGVSKEDSRPAVIQLEEGPMLNTRIYGVNSTNKEELWEKLPLDCKAFIVQKDGFKTVGFMYEGEEE